MSHYRSFAEQPVLIGYMRVSKADGSQTLDLQRDALLAAGVEPGHLYGHSQLISRLRASGWLAPGRGDHHRRRAEWAWFVRDLLDGRYAGVERIVLVMDQRNTHSAASFYQAFPAHEARRLAERVEIHHTPKHGSWLNITEIEFSALTRQCLTRQHAAAPHRAVKQARNYAAISVKWQFTTADARIKLRSLYPLVEGWRGTRAAWDSWRIA